jgi:hypothetical protein
LVKIQPNMDECWVLFFDDRQYLNTFRIIPNI